MTKARRFALTLQSIAALGLAGLTAACGFSPIYADHGEGLMQNLAAVDVARIDSENDAGYMLETELQKKLGSRGTPAYSLQVTVNERLVSEAITRQANTERYKLIMSAKYVLNDSLGEKILSSSARAGVSYGVVDSPYATSVARDNATQTGAEVIAAQIERDLVLYFKGGLVPEDSGIDRSDDFFEDDQ